MRRLSILLLILSALLGACASYPNQHQVRLAALPQHYKQFDVLIGWEVKPGGNGTVVQGVVKNIRYFRMRDLEIWVMKLDANGKVLARGMTFIIPSELGLDESADFIVKLPSAVVAGDRLRFTYKYSGSDGGRGLGDGTPWMQSFDTTVPAK